MAAIKTISLKLAPQFFQLVQKDLYRVALNAALAGCARGVQVIQVRVIPAIQPHQPVNRGLYRASWRYERLPDGARVYNREKVAPLIEFGVRPENVKIGRAMIQALSEWVAMKNILKDKSGASVEDRQATRTVQGMAWAIAKKMKERGIFNNGRGYHVLDKALPDMIDTFQKAWAKRARGVMANVKGM